MEVAIPTELKTLLKQNRAARAVYRSLSDSAKRTYAAYILAANSVKDRQKRAKHATRMLLGQATAFAEAF